VFKSRKIRLTEHVPDMEEARYVLRYLVDSPEETEDPLGTHKIGLV